MGPFSSQGPCGRGEEGVAAARFAKDVVEPYVMEMDEKSWMRKDVIDGLFENGFMGAEMPAEYGGAAASFFAVNLIIEELAKVTPSFLLLLPSSLRLPPGGPLRGRPLRRPEHPRGSHLPPLRDDGAAEDLDPPRHQRHRPPARPPRRSRTVGVGRWLQVGSFCLSEAGSGSDAFALKATAKKDGDDYILNGTKLWITNAEHAGVFFVMANVDPDSGYKGCPSPTLPF